VSLRYSRRRDRSAPSSTAAPGPNGADKSGIPFFGDRAGRPLYEALEEEARCRFTRPIDDVRWDGAALRAAEIRPIVSDAALSNAYQICPTDDGEHFRAPSKAELSSPENVKRMRSELAKARKAESLFNDHGLSHEWHLYSGAHTEEYWHAHVQEYIAWYAAQWNNP